MRDDRYRSYGPQGNQAGHPFYGNQYSQGDRQSRSERDYYGRQSRDDDDEYENRRRAAEMRERDEYGRFAREDDRGGYSRSRRGGDEGEYERQSQRTEQRPRDDYGRFVGEGERGQNRHQDDDYGSRRRSSYENERYEARNDGSRRNYEMSDDEHGRRIRAAENRPRDEYGRFSSDDDRGYSRRQYR